MKWPFRRSGEGLERLKAVEQEIEEKRRKLNENKGKGPERTRPIEQEIADLKKRLKGE
jgi:hypothetical protein